MSRHFLEKKLGNYFFSLWLGMKKKSSLVMMAMRNSERIVASFFVLWRKFFISFVLMDNWRTCSSTKISWVVLELITFLSRCSKTVRLSDGSLKKTTFRTFLVSYKN